MSIKNKKKTKGNLFIEQSACVCVCVHAFAVDSFCLKMHVETRICTVSFCNLYSTTIITFLTQDIDDWISFV